MRGRRLQLLTLNKHNGLCFQEVISYSPILLKILFNNKCVKRRQENWAKSSFLFFLSQSLKIPLTVLDNILFILSHQYLTLSICLLLLFSIIESKTKAIKSDQTLYTDLLPEPDPNSFCLIYLARYFFMQYKPQFLCVMQIITYISQCF